MNQIFYNTVLVQCLAVDLGRLRANLFDIQVLCSLQITEDQIQCQFHIQCGQHLKKKHWQMRTAFIIHWYENLVMRFPREEVSIRCSHYHILQGLFRLKAF